MQFEAQDTTEKRKWIVLKGMIKNGKHHLPQPEESFKTVGILKAETDLKKKSEVPAKPRGLKSLTENDFWRQAGIRIEKWVLKKKER